MYTLALNRLINQARIRLPGALDAAMEMELFSALDELLQGSNAWYADIAVAAVPATLPYYEDPAQYTYPLTPVAGRIVRLSSVWDSGGGLVKATMPTIPNLVLTHSPNTADTYTARVILSVTDPVESDGQPVFPEWVVDQYRDGLLDGLLGKMMSQIAKPYSSPQIAAIHLRKFRSAISRAKVEAAQQNLYRGQTWSFPQTFNR